MKIFVSSTYTDLIEYRKAAERAINLLDQQFRGMEYFGARPEEPKAACLKEVEQADVFVGIYAHRYGFVPEGDATSITEQEFDHAQKLGKPIFCYRVKADQPWNPTFIEKDTKDAKPTEKLAAFLKRIEKDFVRGEFTTPDDLLAKISADLARYLSTHGAVPVIAHPLPPVPYFVHTYPLPAHFTGRARERADLADWMARDARAVFVLEAIGGMGKSALAWVWTQEIFSLGVPIAGVFWWSFYEEREFGRFLDKAIAYASGGKMDAQQIPSDRDRVDALAQLLRQSRFLFILDGFERVLRAYARMDAAYRGDAVDADARDDYRACVNPNIGIFLRCLASGGTLTKTLVTSRLMPRELDGLDGVRHSSLTGMDADDAVEFFHKHGIRGTRGEIQAACAPYGYHPLSLRLLVGVLKQDPRYRADIRNAPSVEMRDADKEGRMTRMLEFAYESLPRDEQKLLSQLSAFRSPMKYETIEGIFCNVIASGAKQSPTADAVIASGAKQSPNSESGIASSQKPLLAMTQSDAGIASSQKPLLAMTQSDAGIASSQKPLLAMTQRDLARAISDLAERGLYMRDDATDTFDLHPVIRRYCYDRLADKQQTHTIFIVYFQKIETPKKIQTLADLQATIELYHHTVRAGRYDEARTLFRDRLEYPTYFQLGAYQLRIELLRALFPDGDPSTSSGQALPRLKKESDQAWTLNSLANSYALAGQPRRAVPLFLQQNDLQEKAGNKQNLAIGLGNVAQFQLVIGEVKAAEENLRRSIALCREIEDEFREAIGHQELGRVLAYRGQFAEAERELAISTAYWQKTNDAQGQSVDSAYRALRALLMGDASAALASARQAREFAEEWERTVHRNERDFIRAEWLIGAALVAGARAARRGEAFAKSQFLGKVVGSGKSVSPLEDTSANASPLQQAEHHLQEALSRDRAIGMVDHEAAILLEFAKLRFAQAKSGQPSAVSGHPSAVALLQESFDFAREALEIAERCEYRLQQAEIHGFLAEWWKETSDIRRQTSDKTSSVVGPRSSVAEVLAEARKHAERAKECASCDGAPYHYKVAYERAERLLAQIDRETK